MKIIKFIKKLFKIGNNGLGYLKVGDIVWAKRYGTDEDKKGHQESPFVIIKKTRQGVYGLQGTSNPHQEVKWKMPYYQLGRLEYGMDKNCYK